MLNDVLKSNEILIKNFDKNFQKILQEENQKDPEIILLNNLINNDNNSNSNKSINFKFSDLMILEDNQNEEINKLKRNILNKTEYAQPAILLHSYLNYLKFINENFKEKDLYYNINNNKHNDNNNKFFFGPSLGEIISLVCAESISLNSASYLLYKRGKFMQQSCPKGKGSMLNVIGDIDNNIKLFNEFIKKNNSEKNEKNEKDPEININLSSIMNKRLIVLSGEVNLIEKCKNFLKENSVNSRKLIVSAAFHSNLMRKGSEDFEKFLAENSEKIFFERPKVDIISTIYPDFIYRKNSGTAEKFDFDSEVKRLLVKQFTEKVDLLKCVRNYYKFNDFEGNEFELYDVIKRKKVDLKDFI